MGEKRAYKPRKPGGGRKKLKPEYDARKNLKEQMERVVALYDYEMSLQAIGEELGLNPIKVRKLLITAGVYKTKIALKNKSIFITGVAGFIGSNLAKRLLSTVEGVKVVGLDNMNNYYDVRLKEARLKELEQFEKFSFVKGNLADKAVIESIFEQYKPEIVVNLGAQAGVRYSITNPDAYVEANLIGFYNILEACRHSYGEGHTPVEHLVYASSSSVYGSNKKVPYSTDDKVDNPVSLYAGGKGHNAAECLRSVRKSE